MPIIVRKILYMETDWMLSLHETKKFKVHQMLNIFHNDGENIKKKYNIKLKITKFNVSHNQKIWHSIIKLPYPY